MKIRRSLLALFAALLLSICTAGARAQETTANIAGQVTDTSGAAVSGAEVTLTNTQTGQVRNARAGDDGYYSFTFIPSGVYDLSVKFQGFKEYLNRSIELFVNDRKTINISLEPGGSSETVVVTAEAPRPP
jgi:hypothetical protein